MNDGVLRCPHGNPAIEVPADNGLEGYYMAVPKECKLCAADPTFSKPVAYKKHPATIVIDMSHQVVKEKVAMAEFSATEHAASKLGLNPKDLVGSKKVSISKLPFAGVIHGAHAMMDGARKYGPFNWRENKVIASIYVDAIYRHVGAWFDAKQEQAPDSEAHHLGHAIACCAILLDAMETGNLVDDRPLPGVGPEILDRLKNIIERRQ